MPTLRILAALALALVATGAASALEPRFDHRDTHGPSLELLLAHDTVQRAGERSATAFRPSLRLGWSYDLLGEGDEVIVGGTVALSGFDDPEDEHVLVAGDVRYRAYFGTEEWKTFFDLGLWVPLESILGAGPLVGLGVQYDLSRRAGVFAAGSFAAAFGQARVASFAASFGVQLRLDLP